MIWKIQPMQPSSRAVIDLTENLELTAGLRWTSEERQQSVELEFLDQAAYREIAFDAIEGVPGLVPLEDLALHWSPTCLR